MIGICDLFIFAFTPLIYLDAKQVIHGIIRKCMGDRFLMTCASLKLISAVICLTALPVDVVPSTIPSKE